MKKITVIIPAYNEEESLPPLYERLEKLMSSMEHYEFEILFVNDGSKDNTINLIKEYRVVGATSILCANSFTVIFFSSSNCFNLLPSAIFLNLR